MDGATARLEDLRPRLAALLARAETPAVSARPVARLVRANEVWLLDYAGRSVHLQDAKGVRQIAVLLGSPGTPIPAAELAGSGGAGGSDLLAARRRRADELREEIADAQAFNDPERATRARAELEQLADEIEQEARARPGERARVNVTRAIRAALRRIEAHEPELGHVLQRTIRTGASCVYRPDPDVPLDWEVTT
jgi:hypothetical protein